MDTKVADVDGWSCAKWGMSKAEVVQAFGSETRMDATTESFGDPPTRISHLSIPQIVIADRSFRAYFFFEPIRGGLEGVLLKSIGDDPLSSFQPMLDSLASKYGMFRSKADGDYKFDVSWHFSSATITLTKIDMLELLGVASVSVSYDRTRPMAAPVFDV